MQGLVSTCSFQGGVGKHSTGDRTAGRPVHSSRSADAQGSLCAGALSVAVATDTWDGRKLAKKNPPGTEGAEKRRWSRAASVRTKYSYSHRGDYSPSCAYSVQSKTTRRKRESRKVDCVIVEQVVAIRPKHLAGRDGEELSERACGRRAPRRRAGQRGPGVLAVEPRSSLAARRPALGRAGTWLGGVRVLLYRP